jgi:hypothetical protein
MVRGLAIAPATATSLAAQPEEMQFMMDENTRQERTQARQRKSAEERRVEAIEDIADSLMDIKDELMQIRIGLTTQETITEPEPPRPFRR